eukprot:GHVP01001941.1.p1 GENE.GHVP01001941.1~~GHVP01001941.1.p1  ORF type:complete len:154 (+),score=25.32 GHVP01001941.1:39-464(+)
MDQTTSPIFPSWIGQENPNVAILEDHILKISRPAENEVANAMFCGSELHNYALPAEEAFKAQNEPREKKNLQKQKVWSLDQLRLRFSTVKDIDIEASIQEQHCQTCNVIFKCEGREILEFDVCFKITTKCVILKTNLAIVE